MAGKKKTFIPAKVSCTSPVMHCVSAVAQQPAFATDSEAAGEGDPVGLVEAVAKLSMDDLDAEAAGSQHTEVGQHLERPTTASGGQHTVAGQQLEQPTPASSGQHMAAGQQLQSVSISIMTRQERRQIFGLLCGQVCRPSTVLGC